MTMLETHNSEMLRRRFGAIADRAYRDLDDKDETAPRKKGDVAERSSRKDGGASPYILYLWLMGSTTGLHLN